MHIVKSSALVVYRIGGYTADLIFGNVSLQLASRGDTVMRALYDFAPQGAGEIQLEVGQVYGYSSPSLLKSLCHDITICLVLDCVDDS